MLSNHEQNLIVEITNNVTSTSYTLIIFCSNHNNNWK